MLHKEFAELENKYKGQELENKLNELWTFIGIDNCLLLKNQVNVFQRLDRFGPVVKSAVVFYLNNVSQVDQINLIFEARFSVNINTDFSRVIKLDLVNLSFKEKMKLLEDQRKKKKYNLEISTSTLKRFGVDIILDPKYYDPKYESEKEEEEFLDIAKRLDTFSSRNYYDCDVINCIYYIAYFMNTFDVYLSREEMKSLLHVMKSSSLRHIEQRVSNKLGIRSKSKLDEFVYKLVEVLNFWMDDRNNDGVLRFKFKKDILLCIENNFFNQIPDQNTIYQWTLIKLIATEKDIDIENSLYIGVRLLREIELENLDAKHDEYCAFALEVIQFLDRYQCYFYHAEILQKALHHLSIHPGLLPYYINSPILERAMIIILKLSPVIAEDEEQSWQLHRQYTRLCMENSKSSKERTALAVPNYFGILSMNEEDKIQYYTDLVANENSEPLDFYKSIYRLFESCLLGLLVEDRRCFFNLDQKQFSFSNVIVQLSVLIKDIGRTLELNKNPQDMMLIELTELFKRVTDKLAREEKISTEDEEQIFLSNIASEYCSYPLFQMFSAVLLILCRSVDEFEENSNPTYQLITLCIFSKYLNANDIRLIDLFSLLQNNHFSPELVCGFFCHFAICPNPYKDMTSAYLENSIDTVIKMIKAAADNESITDQDIYSNLFFIILLYHNINNEKLIVEEYYNAVAARFKKPGLLSKLRSYIDILINEEPKTIEDFPSIIQGLLDIEPDLAMLIITKYVKADWDRVKYVPQFISLIFRSAYKPSWEILGRYILHDTFEIDEKLINYFIDLGLKQYLNDYDCKLAINVIQKCGDAIQIPHAAEMYYYKLNEYYMLQEKACLKSFNSPIISIQHNYCLIKWLLALGVTCSADAEIPESNEQDFNTEFNTSSIINDYIINNFLKINALYERSSNVINANYKMALEVFIEDNFNARKRILDKHGISEIRLHNIGNAQDLIYLLLNFNREKLDVHIIKQLEASQRILELLNVSE